MKTLTQKKESIKNNKKEKEKCLKIYDTNMNYTIFTIQSTNCLQ